MITFTPNLVDIKPLDKNAAHTLVGLLSLEHVEYADYFTDNENDFYTFFFDVLLRQRIPCAINIDWKWHPDDIFSQLNVSVLGDSLTLLAVKDDPDYLAYDITYAFGDTTHNIKVNFADPHQLLADIEKNSLYMSGKSFIDLNFLEDSYSWLIVPENFDTETFKQLANLKILEGGMKPILKPRYDFRHPNLKLEYKQPKKIFFIPTIFYVEDEYSGYIFRYRKLDSKEVFNNIWAGRILPGQTAKEGIAIELESEIGYTGRFDYVFAGYDSTMKDKQGNDVYRYKLTLLLYDKSFSDITRGGYHIVLQKISGFNKKVFITYKP